MAEDSLDNFSYGNFNSQIIMFPKLKLTN